MGWMLNGRWIGWRMKKFSPTTHFPSIWIRVFIHLKYRVKRVMDHPSDHPFPSLLINISLLSRSCSLHNLQWSVNILCTIWCLSSPPECKGIHSTWVVNLLISWNVICIKFCCTKSSSILHRNILPPFHFNLHTYTSRMPMQNFENIYL